MFAQTLESNSAVSRRDCLKMAVASALAPHILQPQTAHAIVPWLLRLTGSAAARGLATRQLSTQMARQTASNGLPAASAAQGSRKVATTVGGLLLWTAARSVAADAGLKLLLDGKQGDRVVVPDARWDDMNLTDVSIPVWSGNQAASVYLDMPPLVDDIHDQLAWALHDVTTGELVKLGDVPVTIMASNEAASMELQIPPVVHRGLVRFVAFLDRNFDSVPIKGTHVVEVV